MCDSEGLRSCGSNQSGMRFGSAETGIAFERALYEHDALINAFDNAASPMGELPDAVSGLISKVIQGDEESVSELWNQYSGALVRSAQSRIKMKSNVMTCLTHLKNIGALRTTFKY